jgi:hypothetical protein
MVSASSFFSLVFSSSRPFRLAGIGHFHTPNLRLLSVEGRLGYPVLAANIGRDQAALLLFHIPMVCSSVSREFLIPCVSLIRRILPKSGASSEPQVIGGMLRRNIIACLSGKKVCTNLVGEMQQIKPLSFDAVAFLLDDLARLGEPLFLLEKCKPHVLVLFH